MGVQAGTSNAISMLLTTSATMPVVAIQPPQRKDVGKTKRPMMRACMATIKVTAMIGTEMIPLTTALQYRAFIGSTGLK